MLMLLLACANPNSTGPELSDGPVYVDFDLISPKLCVSMVPEAGRVRDGRAALADVHAHLAQGSLDAAAASLAAAGEHPAVDAARAAHALLSGDLSGARVGFRELVMVYPEDACLHQAAALTYDRDGEPELARTHATDAWRLLPDEPNVLYIYAIAQAQRGDLSLVAAALRDVLSVEPNHVGASYLLGEDYLARGHVEMALPLLETALDGGFEVVAELLAPVYYSMDKFGDYVRLASRLGMPIGDGGALQSAEDVRGAYREMLGISGDTLDVSLQTSLGTIHCALFWQQAPITVANFVGLSTGALPWMEPQTGVVQDGPMYPGTIFHRTIPGFMIQGGDPLGTGAGGPGWRFPDELHPTLNFDAPGMMAMANAGPGTNGSQFFVTEVPTPHLNGKHTIFGQCDEQSLALVKQIARHVPEGNTEIPPVVLESVTFQ